MGSTKLWKRMASHAQLSFSRFTTNLRRGVQLLSSSLPGGGRQLGKEPLLRGRAFLLLLQAFDTFMHPLSLHPQLFMVLKFISSTGVNSSMTAFAHSSSSPATFFPCNSFFIPN